MYPITDIFPSCPQTVQVTSTFLGAVTALSWVCTLPVMSSTQMCGASDNTTITAKHSSHTPLLSNRQLSSPRERLELAVSISHLPINLVLMKPDLPPTGGAVETIKITARNLKGGGDKGKSFNVTAARKKKEWGPLVTYSYSCYWKCVLFALKLLHSVDKDAADAEVSDAFPSEDGYSSSSNANRLQSISSEDNSTIIETKGRLLPIGSNDLNALADVCISSLDVADEEVATIIDCLSVLLPKVMYSVHT